MEERKERWIACRIPPTGEAALKRLAQDQGTTVSGLMRSLIEQATAANKSREGGQVT